MPLLVAHDGPLATGEADRLRLAAHTLCSASGIRHQAGEIVDERSDQTAPGLQQGIEFFNQRVEAAYRKELVLGEDDTARANPPTLGVLFSDIRRNYFRLYLNFMYFNVGRIIYLQTDVIFPYVLLAPTIIAGARSRNTPTGTSGPTPRPQR